MEQYYIQIITDYIKNYKGAVTNWEAPLVGFASAKDSLFASLKETISPTHALPRDLLTNAQTVITYFIPFAKGISLSNLPRKEASYEWAIAYIETNQLILDLTVHLHDRLQEGGYDACILPATHNFDTNKLISDWSHRHAAFIAGLGKFGLNNMLITEKGCCGRIGSIITTLQLPPTLRSSGENCLYYRYGVCKKCISRCVNGALTETSFDRQLCYASCLDNAKLFNELGLADVCGKCLVDLPCSFTNPVRKTFTHHPDITCITKD